MNIKGVVMAGVGVVVGVIILTIADGINMAIYPTLTETLTQTVMEYVPTLFAVGILIGSVYFGIKSLQE